MGDLKSHFKLLEKDLYFTTKFLGKLPINVKLFCYSIQRPISNIILKTKLKKTLYNDFVYNKIDNFLLNDGGMFKTYVYQLCNQFSNIKNSSVLVPGCGYGRNILQLASFKPKKIIAFDLFSYPKEWKYISEIVKKEFGVEVHFIKGDFDKINKQYSEYFDFIISDAVLEHVRDFQFFTKSSEKVLKKGGIFYASFGPIWFGPGGDHITWGGNKIFDHLILPKSSYKEKLKKLPVITETDSCEGVFMIEKKLFSYLSVKEYLDILSKFGFKKLRMSASISTEARTLLKNKKEIIKLLDEKKCPDFDRFCKGIYLWMKKGEI